MRRAALRTWLGLAVYEVCGGRAERGLPLCVHGEVTDSDVDIFDRERVFVASRLPELLQLFELFDEGNEGVVDVGTLRHLLCDFTSPERLARDEFDEFAASAGLGGGDDVRFDYRKYVRNMMIGTPLESMRA